MADPINQLRSVARQTPRNSPDRSLLDLNILPERHRRKKVSLVKILPFILILILFALLYPSYTQLQSTQNLLQMRESELDQVQAALASYDPLVAEIEGLQSRLEMAQSRIRLILESYDNIQIETTRWSPFLELIVDLIPEGVILSKIDQQENQITFTGFALEHGWVLEFRDELAATGEFNQVQVDFLARVPAETLEGTPSTDEGPEEEEIPVDVFSFQISSFLPEGYPGGQP